MINIQEHVSLKNTLISQIKYLSGLADKKNQKNIKSSLYEVQEKLLNDVFYLVILGEFKRGKSTFINSLLGKNILPTAIIPLTSIVTKVCYGEEVLARVFFQNQTRKEIGLEEIAHYITEKGNPANEKKVEYLEIYYPSIFLENGLVLIDTPGIGSIFEHNTAVTYDFIPKIDAAIFLLTVDHPLSQAEYNLLKDTKEHVPKIFFILNKIDLVPPDDKDESLKFTRKILEEHLAEEIEIYPVSAKQALEAKEKSDEKLLAASMIPRFEQELNSFLSKDRKDVAISSAALKVKNNALSLRFHLQLEQKALQMPFAKLEKKVGIFNKLIGKTRQKAGDQHYIIKGEMNRMLEEFQKELNEYKEKEIYRLGRESVKNWYSQNSHLSSGKLMKEWSKYLYVVLQEIFKEKRSKLEEQLAERVAKNIARFTAQANQLIREFEEETASIFQITIETINNMETLPPKEGFRFIIGTLKDFMPQDPDFFTREKGYFFRLLPRPLAHRKILKEMNWIIFEQVDRNCGRLREDFVERVRVGMQQFEKNITETLENVIKGVENALAQAMQKKEQAAEELAISTERLRQQEHAVKNIIMRIGRSFNN